MTDVINNYETSDLEDWKNTDMLDGQESQDLLQSAQLIAKQASNSKDNLRLHNPAISYFSDSISLPVWLTG